MFFFSNHHVQNYIVLVSKVHIKGVMEHWATIDVIWNVRTPWKHLTGHILYDTSVIWLIMSVFYTEMSTDHEI